MVIRDSVNDYLVRGALADVDPDVADLIRHETARQAHYLIMVPSESTVPEAVREALSSPFHNIYAEGYPLESTRALEETDILDYPARLSEYRRLANERYYKGAEYADIVEALGRRRAAEVFAANGYAPSQLYVNVQPLSGAPANNAVYTALLAVGDTVMGMDLIQGGHLTHGSPVNRSGKFFNIVSYGINADGDIDYDAMYRLAQEHQPKMIIGGYSSFPYQADWAKYREIADSVGAYLLADIAHVAGLVAGGVYPNPVGIADVVTFTTHKTLNGPRGAIIITHRKDLSAKIDRGVFPGEQGGPHVNQMTALCVALKIAKTERFSQLQHQTVSNARRLADKLAARGLKIAYGGTNTHLLNVDLTTIKGADGTTLSGEMAASLLDLVGVVANRQTIPGDTSPLRPNGLRLGTPWITQRGFGAAQIDALADIIADLLLATHPYSLHGRRRPITKVKVPFDVLQDCRARVRDLALSVGIDTPVAADGYPHFHYLDADADDSPQALIIGGAVAGLFLHYALTCDVLGLPAGESAPTALHKPDGERIAFGTLTHLETGDYRLALNQNGHYAAMWLRSLSDAYVLIDPDDPAARLPGPVTVSISDETPTPATIDESAAYMPLKPYFIGHKALAKGSALPRFGWQEPEHDAALTTPLHALHQRIGAKMVPFAGYDMPVWYSSVMDEHLAVRNHAGIFDVAHMGVFDFKGAGAAEFLDNVTTNDVHGLAVGSSHYTYFLDVDGVPLDDLMIYRLADDHFMAVVNASNNDKNWAWLTAVKRGEACIDPAHPAHVLRDDFTMRDLRLPEAGDERRVNIALQGPKSRDILLKMAATDADRSAISALMWAGVVRVTLDDYDLIVSRTGYTGERVAYEIFVHPDRAADLFERFIALDATPCGLASRDSLRTEAGLPLYGHELAGDLLLDPADAGFASYVKLWKPFFVGKSAHVQRNIQRDAVVTRFRLDNKRGRPPHQGDPLVDDRGRVVGIVTSCSVDGEGYQLGQAYIKTDYAKEGVSLGVFAGAERVKALDVASASMGKKITVPERVTVLSRFPRRRR